MIDEKMLIKEIEKINLERSMEYMSCGCTVEQYKKDIGFIFEEVINVINDQPKVMEFISVEERLPENEIRCLVLLDNGWEQIAYYDLEEKNWMLVCDEYYLVENYYRKVISWVPITEVLKCKEE